MTDGATAVVEALVSATPDPALRIGCAAAENVNVAFYQNAIPILRELALTNALGRDVCDLDVRLSSEPAFLTPGVWRIGRIADGAVHHIRALDLQLDPAVLSALTAAQRAQIHVRVEAEGGVLATHAIEVNLLPPAHWGGSGAAPELLAAFVRPTDPAIDGLLREAAAKLAKAGRDPAIDGYAKGAKARTWEIAEAIWTALAAHAIAYVLPPRSFERQGQLVRGPGEILSRKTAACLDLSLLYAACLEQAGLNPLLVLTQGHAFVGLWLVDEDFPTAVIDDAQALRKRVQLEEMILVETTFLTGSPPARFRHAVAQGAKQIAEDAAAPMEIAVDVSRARAARIRPLDLAPAAATGAEPGAQSLPAPEQELDEPPRFEEEMDRRPSEPAAPLDRLEAWKRALLDLTLRNRLLNFRASKSTIAIDCPDPMRLEDLLTDGKRFRLQGAADVLSGRDPELMAQRREADVRRAFTLDAMDRGDLHTDISDDELEGRLTELYRGARLAFEEGGANVLYLCMGFLRWTPQDGAGPYRAPLVLVPVSLERKSVRSGFRLALHEDDIRFNATLLQLLRQDFGLAMPELDADLPSDGAGVDVAAVWNIVRRHVKALKGWEVTEEVTLAALSFTKYLMWKDLVDRTADLKRNAVVRHLIDTPTHAFEGGGGDFLHPSALDEAIEPADIFAPLSADSSQLASVVSAQRGKDFVLFGPPGTGKSQTITNMIANCLAHGRSVLFVSQKTAALEVVRRRMQDVGLGNYCLEVHSTKAQKSVVIGQLATAWRERAQATEENWTAANAQLKAWRDQLNQLVSALHRRRPNGMSAYEAFGRVIADRDTLPHAPLSWPAGTWHTPDALAAMRAACADLRTSAQATGDPSVHPLRGIEQTKWSPAWARDLETAIARMRDALRDLRESSAWFASLIGLTADSWDFADVARLMQFGRLLIDPAASDGALLLAPEGLRRARALEAATKLVAEAAEKMARLSAPYDLKATRLDLAQAQRDWAEACASSFLFRSSRKSKVRLLVAPYCAGDVPEEIGADLVALQDLSELVEEARKLAPEFDGMPHLWDGLETDVSRFPPMMAWAEKMRLALRALGQRANNADSLQSHVVLLLSEYEHLFADSGEARPAMAAFENAWAQTQAAAGDLAERIGLADAASLVALEPGWDTDLEARMARWNANLLKAPAWARWRAAAHAASELGLAPLVEALESGAADGDALAQTFEYSYARWLADAIVNEDETLSSFLAEQHEATIAAFVAADQKVAELSCQIVRARIGGGVPTLTNFGKDPEWGTLAREINKKARHMPLRQLFGRIPGVLTKLAPCVMMSPLSIAQYLPPDAKPFDVVIFDEASQIPVWDAIGAIARGTQVVVVGDPEQLPPTSVGQRSMDGEVDMDVGPVQSQQSILDECLASNIPSMRLSWHYRSRHESLIAFSNAKYYRGELTTFPSPVTQDTAVRYVHVPDGVYERGGAKINRKEADAVAAEVVRRLKDEPHSIGVVTFNAEQQRLIENLLDQARRADPSLERHFDRTQTSEPIFVKNIENVQGDERDVIIFSVAVGPDQTGRVTAQISSLNGEGGHRRLNVAITRARRELLVYATLRPEQIDLGRTNARGVLDFKHFLEFAQKGARAIAEAFAPTGRQVESPFEAAVKAALEGRGWQVHPQIGVSFFRVDLGVVHPDHPGRYLAGVECDGATYHSSATARDRDRLRELVLTGLGWRIRRVWSTEWWMDQGSAFEKLQARLVADLEADRAETLAAQARREQQLAEKARLAAEESAASTTSSATDGAQADAADAAAESDDQTFESAAPAPSALSLEEPRIYARGPDGGARRYVLADPAEIAPPDRTRFYDDDYLPVVRRMAEYVIATEGPLYVDLLVTRIARAHGFARAKDAIRGVVRTAIEAGAWTLTRDDDRDLVWPAGAEIGALSPWRGCDGRENADIPLVELASLADELTETGGDTDALVRAMQAHMGLARLAASTRERFEEAVMLASIQGRRATS